MKNKLMDLVEQKRDFGKEFRVGDTIKVHYRIKEGQKERIQVFNGFVIAKTAHNFTIRKISLSVGVEKKIPLNSPYVEKIEVVKRGRVRRAKLYYLREKIGKAARIKEAK